MNTDFKYSPETFRNAVKAQKKKIKLANLGKMKQSFIDRYYSDYKFERRVDWIISIVSALIIAILVTTGFIMLLTQTYGEQKTIVDYSLSITFLAFSVACLSYLIYLIKRKDLFNT